MKSAFKIIICSKKLSSCGKMFFLKFPTTENDVCA